MAFSNNWEKFPKEAEKCFSYTCALKVWLISESESTHRHMTVGLVDLDSNVRRILVLLDTNGVCITDSTTKTDKS